MLRVKAWQFAFLIPLKILFTFYYFTSKLHVVFGSKEGGNDLISNYIKSKSKGGSENKQTILKQISSNQILSYS